MAIETSRKTWQTLLAFGIIYFVWGSTFLAIRIGVHEAPPLVFATMRFFTAGLVLFGFMLVRGERLPSGRQWLSILLLALLIFVIDYGLLFWAEQRVASGIAAVMMATIPAFTAIAEIVILRTQRLTMRLGFALLIGIGGVSVLMSRSLALPGAPVDCGGAFALLAGGISWSLASVLSRRLALPANKVMSSGAQMLTGGALLATLAAGRGELHVFHATAVSGAAWWSLVYLIVFGSIVGFTAYLWLLHHESPTRVATYAYVNTVVAVLLGYLFASEPLGARTVIGIVLVVVSVAVITTAKRTVPAAAVRSRTEGETA